MYRRLAAVLFVVAVACGVTTAPPFDGVGEACADTGCLGVPEGWAVVDEGPRHVTIEHPDGASATIGTIDMDRVATATGGTWPQSDIEVVRGLWALFDGGEARLESTSERRGAIASEGESQGSRQWHLLVPLDRPHAIGVVVQAPNGSWFRHVEAIFDGVRPGS